MTIIIHKTSVSPPARATLMVVDILGLKVETREVNLPTREQFKPEYLQKNPLHTVPLLEDGDLVVSDSHAIITYLVSEYGNDEQRKLYPITPAVRAKIDQRLLRTVIYSVVKSRMRMTVEQVNDIEEAYSVTEKYLSATQYIACDYLTLADISCVSTISSLDCVVPIEKKYVKLLAWWNRLKKERWYQKENEPGLKLFDGFIKNFL